MTVKEEEYGGRVWDGRVQSAVLFDDSAVRFIVQFEVVNVAWGN